MEKIDIEIRDGHVVYYPDFFERDEADMLFAEFKDTLSWQQDQIKIFGKVHDVPRLQAWYGDKDMSYSYSGIELTPLPWTNGLQQVKTRIEAISNHSFNSALANLYRTGQDSNGWHADNEKELGLNPVIASITLGHERMFKIKHTGDKNLKKNFLLEHGSLLIMQGPMQHYWKHTIAKTAKPIGERINLTFRKIIKKK